MVGSNSGKFLDHLNSTRVLCDEVSMPFLWHRMPSVDVSVPFYGKRCPALKSLCLFMAQGAQRWSLCVFFMAQGAQRWNLCVFLWHIEVSVSFLWHKVPSVEVYSSFYVLMLIIGVSVPFLSTRAPFPLLQHKGFEHFFSIDTWFTKVVAEPR